MTRHGSPPAAACGPRQPTSLSTPTPAQLHPPQLPPPPPPRPRRPSSHRPARGRCAGRCAERGGARQAARRPRRRRQCTHSTHLHPPHSTSTPLQPHAIARAPSTARSLIPKSANCASLPRHQQNRHEKNRNPDDIKRKSPDFLLHTLLLILIANLQPHNTSFQCRTPFSADTIAIVS